MEEILQTVKDYIKKAIEFMNNITPEQRIIVYVIVGLILFAIFLFVVISVVKRRKFKKKHAGEKGFTIPIPSASKSRANAYDDLIKKTPKKQDEGPLFKPVLDLEGDSQEENLDNNPVDSVSSTLDKISKKLDEDTKEDDYVKRHEEHSIISYEELLERAARMTPLNDNSFFEQDEEEVPLSVNEYIQKQEDLGNDFPQSDNLNEELSKQLSELEARFEDDSFYTDEPDDLPVIGNNIGLPSDYQKNVKVTIQKPEEPTVPVNEKVNQISEGLKELNLSSDLDLMMRLAKYKEQNQENNKSLKLLKEFKERL